MRSLGTTLGVALILAVIIAGNRTYFMVSDSEKFSEIQRSVALFMSSEERSHLDWTELEATGGSFAEGAVHTAYAKSLEGTRVYISGYGIPLDRGKFKVASVLPAVLSELLMGAKPKTVYRFQTRFMLAPLPLKCYLGGNPEAKQTMYVQMAAGEMVDIEPEVPLYLSGVLQLRSESERFFYVLTDVRKEEVAGVE